MDVSQNILLLLLLLLVVRAVATAAAVAVHSDQTRQWEVRQLLDVQTTTSSVSEKCECVCVLHRTLSSPYFHFCQCSAFAEHCSAQ